MPFNRFRTADGRSVDTVLGPEMRSTGEVMGIDADFGMAFAKAQAAAFGGCRSAGGRSCSVANRDKRHMIFPIKRLADLGFEILATAARPRCCAATGCRPTVVRKHSAGRRTRTASRPSSARIHAGEVDLVVNTPHGTTSGGSPRLDGYEIRTASVATQHRLHHHRAGARAPPCRASRRSSRRRSACGRCRAGPPSPTGRTGATGD